MQPGHAPRGWLNENRAGVSVGAGRPQPLQVRHQPVDAGDPRVVDGAHAVSEQFGGDAGLLGDGDVGGPGADDEDVAGLPLCCAV